MHGSLVRRFAITVAIALCVAAGFAIWVVLAGRVDSTALRALGSALVGLVCMLTGLAGATVLDREDARRWVGLVTILLSGIELALLLVFVWTLSGSDTLGHALGVSSAVLVAFVHASLMLGRVRHDDTRVTRRLTGMAIACVTLAAVIVSGGLLFVATAPLSGIWRLLGVLVVLGTLGTLLTPIARRLGRRPAGGSGAVDGQEPPSPSAVSSRPPSRTPAGMPGRRWLMLGVQGARR